jgi:hypothetical protein
MNYLGLVVDVDGVGLTENSRIRVTTVDGFQPKISAERPSTTPVVNT